MESQYGKECVQEELEKIVSDWGMVHDHVRCRDCKIGRFGVRNMDFGPQVLNNLRIVLL